MKRTPVAIALAAFLLTTTIPANAAVNVRQLDQQRRIDAGKRSGKLTENERLQLKAEQRSIVRLQHRMKARHGGELTRRDEQILHARQRAAEQHIHHAKHNAHRGKNHLPF